MIIRTTDYKITIADTPEMKEAVFAKVVDYFQRVNAWSGESIMQRDKPQEEAAPLMADLIDNVLKPEVEWR